METPAKTMHPLVAGAAAAVITVSAVAIAAVAGYLPGSKADFAPDAKAVSARQDKSARANAGHVKAACRDCGVIVQVKEVDVPGKGTGVGAIAGGVAGAVIGREIGDGNRAGTAAGAVVGGVAGHQIERQARAYKRYDITVRMADGSVRNLSSETGTPPTVRSGDRVRVSRDGIIKPA